MAQRVVIMGGSPLTTFKHTFQDNEVVKLSEMSGITLPEKPERFNKVSIVVESGSIRLWFTQEGEGATFPSGSIIELDQYSQVANAYLKTDTSPATDCTIYVYGEI